MSDFDVIRQPADNRIADDGAVSNVGPTAHISPDLLGLAFPLGGLRLDPTNAKIHGDDSVNAIAESYRRHGQVKPLIGKRLYRGVENVIVAGNGGLLAARRLGWQAVAVLWLPDSASDDAVRDYAYRDNLTHEPARWNEDQLRADADAGLDLLSLGFDGATLADLLAADAPTPRFLPEAPAHRLDQLADDAECPRCGFQWHQGAR